MATYSEGIRSRLSRAMPNFSLLKVGAHETDARAATTIVIVGMAIGLYLMLSLVFGAPAQRLALGGSGERVAPPPAADRVTIVGETPRLDVPCSEQTWPYLDRRCLSESTQKRPQPAETAKPAEAAKDGAKDRTRDAAKEATKDVAPPPIDPRHVATAPVIPSLPPSPQASAETQVAPRYDPRYDPYALPPREWRAQSDAAIMQDEAQDEVDDEVVYEAPPMPPPQYRRERPRRYDAARDFERQFRAVTRQIFPRF